MDRPRILREQLSRRLEAGIGVPELGLQLHDSHRSSAQHSTAQYSIVSQKTRPKDVRHPSIYQFLFFLREKVRSDIAYNEASERLGTARVHETGLRFVRARQDGLGCHGRRGNQLAPPINRRNSKFKGRGRNHARSPNVQVWLALLNPRYSPPRTPWEKSPRATTTPRATDIFLVWSCLVVTGDGRLNWNEGHGRARSHKGHKVSNATEQRSTTARATGRVRHLFIYLFISLTHARTSLPTYPGSFLEHYLFGIPRLTGSRPEQPG